MALSEAAYGGGVYMRGAAVRELRDNAAWRWLFFGMRCSPAYLYSNGGIPPLRVCSQIK